MSSGPNLKLGWCSIEAATFACKNWHYSGAVPTPPHNAIGVWEQDAYIGCVIFSRGANRNIGRPYNLTQAEVCELTRVALRAHQTPVSRILRIALKFLREQSPGLRLIVSYADRGQNHHGGIYQAAGWVYTGTSQATRHYIDRYGKRWHHRNASARGTGTGLRIAECTAVPEAPKHRYVLALDSAMRDQVALMAKPYPKRTDNA